MSEQKQYFDLKREEVEDFFKRADSLIIRADEILSDHYKSANRLGSDTVQAVCEVYANAGAFRRYLDKIFKLEQASEEAVFRVDSKHVQMIMTFVMALMDCKKIVSEAGLSLKEH